MKSYKFSYILSVVLSILTLISCEMEELNTSNNSSSDFGVFGDKIKLPINAIAPDRFLVNTKAVDPDGKGVQTMTLFCFNEQGLFISTATAEVAPNPENSEVGGIFDAFIPNTTRVMHLVGNQNMTPFKEDDFRQKSEDEVMSILEGSAGMLIYWARVEVPSNVMTLYSHNSSTQRSMADAILDWITIETNPASVIHNSEAGKNKPIIMLRNQAKFTVTSTGAAEDDAKQWSGTYFKVTGFTVCNTQAFGTVAPYNSTTGFPTYECSTFTTDYGIEEWKADNSICLPANKDILSDIMEVSTSEEVFVFETENSSANPVDVIIKGCNVVNDVEQMTLYYKVNVTKDGDQLPIRRNHHYNINITGNLNYGSATFAEALDAPATNNIWLSISDEITAVMNNDYKLSVEKTSVVVNNNSITSANNTLQLNFNVEAIGEGKTLNVNDLSVAWLDNTQKISNTHNPNLVVGDKVSFETSSGEGTITLNLLTLSSDVQKQEGTLLVKYGQLQRKIKIIILRTQSFVPSWISTEVYGKVSEDVNSRANATLMFTIPETCPDELFPLDVMISVNGLDIRSESGMVLPIVREGEAGYGAENGIGYKYKYTVNNKGVQRVYFENILNVEDGATETIVLEAENFETLTKTMTFSGEEQYISVDGMLSYNYSTPGTTEISEVINYILVPQKRYAPVTINLKTLKKVNTTESAVSLMANNDEFLLYSSNLDHYVDNDDCHFKPYGVDSWGTGGRIFGFYPRQNISNGAFEIYMETNKAKSAEVVRIASNQTGSPTVKNASVNYSGQTFRSVTFELANYSPFRFAAQVNGRGTFKTDFNHTAGTTPEDEEIENISLTYTPEQKVEVSFDITSFQVGETSVDPFGTGFEIFIDAPSLMLHPEDNQTIKGQQVAMFEKNEDGSIPTTITQKAKLEDLGNGRFVYRVDPVRATEASFWGNATPKIADAKATSQVGERKTIVFRTNQIVSSGDIVISSNKDHVVYHTKKFRVTNIPITGEIKYNEVTTNGTETTEKPVPAGQFIAFSRTYNGSRIGSMVINSDGNYELRLRKEYEFYWFNDPITIIASINGTYYSTQIADLKTLFDSPNIILNKMTEDAE